MTATKKEQIWLQFLISIAKFVDRRISQSSEHSTQVAKWASTTARELKMTDE